jgi:hypothetical protein
MWLILLIQLRDMALVVRILIPCTWLLLLTGQRWCWVFVHMDVHNICSFDSGLMAFIAWR